MDYFLIRILVLLTLIYLFIRLYISFFVIPAGGDEPVFLYDLLLTKEYGFQHAVEKGISIPYILLSIPLSYLFDDLIAMRIVSLSSFIVLNLYLWWRYKNGYILMYLSIFACFNGYFFLAYNDSLLILGLVIFFSEIYRNYNQIISSLTLAFIGLILAIFTREFFVIYLPAILFALSGLAYYKRIKVKNLIIPVLITLGFLALNIPSIQSQGTLSNDNKPARSEKVNWVQYQYLSQLEINQGKIPENYWVSWKEVEDYIAINGEHSLPKTTLESLTFDISLTIKEFFKDSAFVIIKSIREIVILHFISILFLIISLRKSFGLQTIYRNYIPIVSWMMIFIFAFVMINNVETRWLSTIYILLMVYCFHNANEYKYKSICKVKINWILSLNNILAILVILYGIYSRILPIIN